MIKIEKLSIRQFRGIRELDLNLNGQNFGVFGPNGSGKSGVVDAIEFVLTGSITRLTGKGSDDLSVARHGPHVDAGESSPRATVTVTGVLSDLQQEVTIQRSVASPSKPEITPDTPEIRSIVAELAVHPELALARRDIVKYVITPPSERHKDVTNLLKLDRLQKIRSSLFTCSNSKNKERQSALSERNSAWENLKQGLGISDVKPETLLKAINELRETAGLTPIPEISPDTIIYEFQKETEDQKNSTSFVKSLAATETQKLLDATSSETPDISVNRTKALAELQGILDDMRAFQARKQKVLVARGLELVEEDACPLCDNEWKREDLIAYLTEKLESATAAAKAIETANNTLKTVSAALVEYHTLVLTAEKNAKHLGLDKERELFENEACRLEDIRRIFTETFDSQTTIETTRSKLDKYWASDNQKFVELLDTLAIAIQRIPEISAAETARSSLILAQERYGNCVKRSSEYTKANARAEIAKALLETYDTCSTNALNRIYDEVENDFKLFYKALNKGDEDTFEGKLTPKPAKLSLNVDFYGRGKFPPGAYHSEGHQDGMGLCLYLALMRKTMGDRFRFCVLDDVLMSVDAGHRRQVCRLLTSEFPKTQFVLTTHDRVWLEFMKAEGLIGPSITFGGWHVDTGPFVIGGSEMIDRVYSSLDTGDVPTAAARLRRFLEHMGYILCDGLRASVRFRGNGHYTLNELMPPALKAVKDRMVECEKAARSWNKNPLADKIAGKRDDYKAAVARSKVEEWATNPTVHWNAWENLEPDEFREIVDGFRIVLEFVQCKDCCSFLHLTFGDNAVSGMECRCGEMRYGLLKNTQGSIPLERKAS